MIEKKIRNFSIIAHVDSGKSTLAKEMLWLSLNKEGEKKYMVDKFLDNLLLEREREITIKLKPLTLYYQDYIFNLIDTPGHVDFSYEVSRALAACEGVILLVDGVKGVQAQTLSYFSIAKSLNLKVIPVINKVDSELAQLDKVTSQIYNLIPFKSKDEVLLISARNGFGIDKVMNEIINKIPAPINDEFGSFKALIFDLLYNKYYGVIIYIKITNGSLKPNEEVFFLSSKKIHKVERVGIRAPEEKEVYKLYSGEIGWFSASIKDIREVKVGDTVVSDINSSPLEGYKKTKQKVYSNIYPNNIFDYLELKKILGKLQLQDGSFTFEPINSQILGAGFNCGFQGVLHRGIITGRIEKEYNFKVIVASATVDYKINFHKGNFIEINNAYSINKTKDKIVSIEEIFISIVINTPEEFLGPITELIKSKRGIFVSKDWKVENFYSLTYNLPFAEFVEGFDDRIKTISQGFASFDYNFIGYRKGDILKIDILLNKEIVPDLSFFCHKSSAYSRARSICNKLKDTLNRQNFSIPIQACIGKHVIARETISPLRKDVTEKLYGGDATRRMKLLDKQKRGKKKMGAIGKINFNADNLRSLWKKD